MLRGMENSILGMWVAHGEGKLSFPNDQLFDEVISNRLAPISYVDDKGQSTERYPFNPNGSLNGIAGITDRSGKILGLMPHPERNIFKHHYPFWKESDAVPFGIKFFENAVNSFK